MTRWVIYKTIDFKCQKTELGYRGKVQKSSQRLQVLNPK